MSELWAMVDSLPVLVLLGIGMAALGLSYLVDVINDARGEWK